MNYMAADQMLELLSTHTYMVRHNPNCPSPYEIRTCGHAPLICPGDGRNFVSYGRDFEQAAREVLAKIEDHERRQRVARTERAFAGLVWG